MFGSHIMVCTCFPGLGRWKQQGRGLVQGLLRMSGEFEVSRKRRKLNKFDVYKCRKESNNPHGLLADPPAFVTDHACFCLPSQGKAKAELEESGEGRGFCFFDESSLKHPTQPTLFENYGKKGSLLKKQTKKTSNPVNMSG